VSSDFEGIFGGDWNPEDERCPPPENSSGEPENQRPRILHEKEVKVVNVFEGVVTGANLPPAAQATTFVLLRDNRGRDLRIFVNRDVAYSISLAVAEETPDRPYTHDLMRTMLERFGGKVDRIIIDDLWQDTFYAKIYLLKAGSNNEVIEIDSRPSDAIALALRFRAPIYVAEAVLEAAQTES
jgi:bifunctional DNase/RNase